jgi:aminopeptidase N
MRRAALPILAIVTLAACGAEPGGDAVAPGPGAVAGSSSSSPLPPPAIPDPPPPRDDGRLPATAIPLRYVLSLRIDPAQPHFAGTATILIDVPQPTWHVVMHGRGFTVSRVSAQVAEGPPIDGRATFRLTHGGVAPEELVLTFAKPLPAGKAVLQIQYDAPFAEDLAGLYRVSENGVFYAFSQFEATDARRAFPCFDEPGFKTSYDVTITAPKGLVALTNSPETSHEDGPEGTVVHHFETSPPLPSYLVAFAVGDFDVIGGQTAPFPIRVITTKGRSKLANLALEAATGLVRKLGDYFDIRYPYAKLDLVAVPDFDAGAMENPGLITFRDVLILLDPSQATTTLRRRQAIVIAHELAHQWFGDLVTMQWWDDIWLNEGFATWAEAKIVDEWRPSFGATMDQIAGIQDVMDTDSLRSARAVRQPVVSSSDAMESFDELTYDKGAAILRMIESWLGADTFRRGVHRYLVDNAWKNARADDLFKALDYVSAQRVGELASGFLDQPGVPEVTVAWKCGGRGGGQLDMRQSQWRALGAAPQPPRSWVVPVCTLSDAQKGKSCFTLGGQQLARDLGPKCPSWFYPNAEGGGYYRYSVDRAQLQALAAASRGFPAVDRMGLVTGAWAEVRKGDIGPALLLDILPRFDGDNDRHVVEQVIDVLTGISDSLIDEGDREPFRKYAAARLEGRARALGWNKAPPPGTSPKVSTDDRALERGALLAAMGDLVEEKGTLAEADQYAEKWLKDPASVSGEIAAIALPLASKRAGAERLEALRAAAKNTRTPEERMNVIRAMGSFEDAAVLRKALDLTLTDELRLSELRYLFGGAVQSRVARPVLFAWEKENWDRLLKRIPGSFGRGSLVAVAGTACTRAERDLAEAFFVPATQGLEGVKRPLDEKLEQAGLCVALREHSAGEVSKYLGHK